MEPRAAAPARRLQTIRRLAEAGVPVGVSISPVIPFLNEPEMEQVAGVLHKMCGQVRATQDGYRLVFPSSLSRMRVVPFMLKGQRYAVAAAQYVQFESEPDQAEGVGKILLRSGQVTKALLVDRVLPAENANITPIPDLIERPDWLIGVMVDHEAEIHLCISPV